ncbi:hypothetical protein ACQP0C_23345 [Nocardia sp. CA-129566]|uniref:hypothetical protein n=1 Tax=Nocardia sp. CA-129566 TaxID=3239976 RepID=UPI003D97D234
MDAQPRAIHSAHRSGNRSGRTGARDVGAATWRYRARVRVAAPATDVRSRLPAAVTVEPDGPNHCVLQVGSDTPHMLTLYLGLLDVDFEVLDAPELAAHLLATAERFRKAAGEN